MALGAAFDTLHADFGGVAFLGVDSWFDLPSLVVSVFQPAGKLIKVNMVCLFLSFRNEPLSMLLRGLPSETISFLLGISSF